MKRLFLIFVIGISFGSSPSALGNLETERSQLLDEQAAEKELSASTDQEVRRAYSILLDALDLTSDKEEALLRWLIQARIAATYTAYRVGRPLSEEERSRQIAEIIGPSKQAEFLRLERHIYSYAEASKLEALLERRQVPMSNAQREELVKLLVAADDQFAANREPPENSYEGTKRIIARLNERERHIVEMLPGVLSVEQVNYVYDQYEFQKQRRLDSLEQQRKYRAEHPDENLPWSFPAF